MLKSAKKKFMEALEHYEAAQHYYGTVYCADMLFKLKNIPREFTASELKNLEKKQNYAKNAILGGKFDFVERKQGAEMSLFIENVFETEVDELSLEGKMKRDAREVGDIIA